MIYGLDTHAFIENGPGPTAAEVRSAHPSERYGLWQKLGEQSRLRMVETALKPANDLVDGYPLAL